MGYKNIQNKHNQRSKAFDFKISWQNDICELLQSQLSVFVFVAVLEKVHNLSLSADLTQYSSHVLKLDISFSLLIVKSKHLLESSQAGLGQDSFLVVLLSVLRP